MLRCRAPLFFFLKMFPPPSPHPTLNPNPNSSAFLLQLNPIRTPPSNSSPHRRRFSTFSCNYASQSQAMTISNCCPDPISAAPESDRSNPHSTLMVVSFYRFADFPDHANLRKPLKDLCEELRVSGGIILAPEGINGSICGTRDSVERVLALIESDSRLKGLRKIESPVSPEEEAIHHGHTISSPLAAGEDAPFRWDHVRIVTLGMPTVSPIEKVGKYVKPREWNSLISDPDTVVIDVRNNYEIRIGKFKGAVDPCTSAFRDFPSWVDDNFELPEADNGDQSDDSPELSTGSPNGKKPPRVAMYCTGGIRCEKASSFLLRKGFEEVYHLEGGILKYLEEVPESESLWEGECFVFDKRVSVEHGLAQGTFKLCYGCKQPVSDADMEAPEWEYAVSCPYCYSSKSEEEKDRARARQRQFETWGIIGGPDKGRRPTFVDKKRTPNKVSPQL
ncbi:Rhodanese-like domain-containing protein 7 [Linum perenne]